MTKNEFYLILAGILGVIFHCLLKYRDLRTDAIKANLTFSVKRYWYYDHVSIILSFLSVWIWYLLFKEAAAKYRALSDFARASFVTMGLVGSYAIQKFAGQAKKRINEVIDKKTDIADNKTKNDS